MSEAIRIRLRQGTPAERRTRAAVEALLAAHDLDGLVFTAEMEIEEGAIPHSHPVMVMNTAFEGDRRLLLAEFVHEQLHWFEEAHATQRDRAIEATVEHYPSVPVDPPEGAGDETSTRLHLLVCYLEYQALRRLLGPVVARETIERLSRHHYCWVYRTVLEDEALIGGLIDEYDLRPDALTDRNRGVTGRSSRA